jgi:hypothetical protein
MAQPQLIFDGLDSVPKYRLRCSCGNEKFRYSENADQVPFWLNLLSSRKIAEYRPGGISPKLDSSVRCTSCSTEYDKSSTWNTN